MAYTPLILIAGREVAPDEMDRLGAVAFVVCPLRSRGSGSRLCGSCGPAALGMHMKMAREGPPPASSMPGL